MENNLADVLLTKDHVILRRGPHSLWCDRKAGTLIALPGSVMLPDSFSPVTLGKAWGCIGKIRFFTDGDWKLLLVSHASSIGVLPQWGEVYCIERIAIVTLSADPSTPEVIGLEPSPSPESSGPRPVSPALGKKIMSKLDSISVIERERDKLERRLTEALLWMFNDSRSFYFCLDSDITQSLQRQLNNTGSEHLPFWQRIDERFFWNKMMLADLIGENYAGELADPWILPVIQGYVEVRQIPVLCHETPDVLQAGGKRGQEERGRRGEATNLKSKSGPPMGWGSYEMVEMVKGQLSRVEIDPQASIRVNSDSRHTIPAFGSIRSRRKVANLDGYESDTESSRDTDTDLDEYYEEFYPAAEGVSSEEEKEEEDGGTATLEEKATGDERGDSSEKVEGTGLEEDETNHVLDSEKQQRELVADSQPLIDVQAPLTQEEAQKDSLTTSGKDHQRNAAPSPSNLSPPKPSKDDTSLSDTSDMEASLSEDRQQVTPMIIVEEVKESLGGERTKLQHGRTELMGDQNEEEGEYCLNGNPFLELEELNRDSTHLKFEPDEGEGEEAEEDNVPKFTLAIISRRSRHRAGTRYRRRGVDTDGHVANYVETELILEAGSHQVSYVMVRGSVPVFWTQPGYKYRPPPIIEEGEEETQAAFRKHFEEQLGLYQQQAILNLINESGREKPLSDAFEKHVLLLDNPLLTYVAFDFHRQYKHNPQAGVKLLLNGTEELIRRFKFCWFDTEQASKPLCRQEGVFRFNCMDCLDRTNVIQSVVAKEVMQSALQKLGVIPFDEKLGGPTLTAYQEMWGNNGDTISRQYTGTAAMKGDITRYGERKFSGMMRDGYNSAHRYYLNLFSDTYRQVLIDLMQGYTPSEAFASLPRSLREDSSMATSAMPQGTDEEDLAWSLDREQTIADMIQQCRQCLFPNKSLHVQGWALVEAAGYSFLESSQKEEDCVMLQCREMSQLCLASYNSDIEQLVCFIRIPMNNIQKIVVGPLGMLLRSSKRLYMRIFYTLMEDKTCYFTLRTMNFTTMDEDKAILLSIAEALAYIQPSITIHEQKLSRKRSPTHKGVIHLVLPEDWDKDWLEVDSDDDSIAASNPTLATQLEENAISQSSTTPLLQAEEHLPNSHEAVISAAVTDLFEKEHEQSFSAPSSPKLSQHRQPLMTNASPHRLRSQSFDDLLSPVTREPLHQSSQTMPPPGRMTSVLKYHPLDNTHSSSESDTELEVSNNMGSQEEGLNKEPLSEVTDSQQSLPGGTFTRLKGRFLQKVKQGSSKPSQSETEDSSEVQSKSQVAQKLLAVGQKFRNSPSLLRKMGVNFRNKSPQPPPTSDEDAKRREAREKSQTKFVYIHA